MSLERCLLARWLLMRRLAEQLSGMSSSDAHLHAAPVHGEDADAAAEDWRPADRAAYLLILPQNCQSPRSRHTHTPLHSPDLSRTSTSQMVSASLLTKTSNT